MGSTSESSSGIGDAIRKRRKESERLTSISPEPEVFDVETGSYSELHKKISKKKIVKWFCLNPEDGFGNQEEYRISGSFALLSTFFLLGIGLLIVKHLDASLPPPLQITDIQDHPESFIEERARKDLYKLTSIGVRVSGSTATDEETVNEFLSILSDINANGLSVGNDLKYEVQKPTGAFFMEGDEGQISSYSNIANVVAKLEPSEFQYRTNSSILVNCHFDTKPGSPGATDNMISCATMLEVIRVLAKDVPSSPRNSLVFLFNGAEELGLQGAHGFVKGYQGEKPPESQMGHAWAKNLKSFINLEGAGGGGREILFQTGPGNSWTLESYAKGAPYPYGLAVAEEAFQLGLIPSDTDFRIFRDFGDLYGLDMAFIKNGWVYHTKWDRINEITAGSIQHMGANALGILKHMTNLDFTKIKNSSGKVVFFDVLGLFMIYYPRWAGILIDCLIAVCTIGSIVFNVFQMAKRVTPVKLVLSLVWLVISAILSWAVGIGVAGLVAVFLNACGYAKPFYSYPSLAMIIFGFPAAITQIIVQSYAQQKSPVLTWMSQKLTLAVVLFISTFITRAVYIISINLLFSVVAWNLTRFLCRGWPRAVTLTYLIAGEFIPFLMSSYLLITMSDVFVPILGRSGSETNANLFFGLITSAVVTILIWNGFTFLFVNFRRRILWTCLLAMFFVGNTVLVFGFIGKIPYQEKTPMRLNIVNVDRTWHAPDGRIATKTEQGFWFWPYDSNTKDFLPTFEEFVPELKSIQKINLDYNTCDTLYCAQPFIWPTTNSIKTTYWLSHNNRFDSTIKAGVDMSYTVRGTQGDPERTIEFEFTGPTQVTIVLSPGPRYKLVSWTISSSVPESGSTWQGRQTYFIFHGRGMDEESFSFSCTLQLVDNSDNDNVSPLMNIQYTGLFLYGDQVMTPQFTDMINRLPSWTYTMPWMAVMKMYQIS